MVAEHRLDIARSGVHKVASRAAVDVYVDKTRRNIKAARIDQLGVRRDNSGIVRRDLLDPAFSHYDHPVRDQPAIGNHRSIVKDLPHRWIRSRCTGPALPASSSPRSWSTKILPSCETPDSATSPLSVITVPL